MRHANSSSFLYIVALAALAVACSSASAPSGSESSGPDANGDAGSYRGAFDGAPTDDAPPGEPLDAVRAMPDSGADADAAAPMGGDGGTEGRRGNAVLVFTRTTGYRHASIEPAAMALHDALSPLGFAIEISADETTFTAAGLARFVGVVLVSTTGKPLGDPGVDAQNALLAFVRAGGALVGIHAASSTEYDPTLPYTPLIGGKFIDHPGGVRNGVCHPTGQHPSVARLPANLSVFDEIYFMDHLNAANQVDLHCDALSGGAPLPIAWHRVEGMGRVFYTALGHNADEYAATSPVFKDHIIPAVLWALGP